MSLTRTPSTLSWIFLESLDNFQQLTVSKLPTFHAMKITNMPRHHVQPLPRLQRPTKQHHHWRGSQKPPCPNQEEEDWDDLLTTLRPTFRHPSSPIPGHPSQATSSQRKHVPLPPARRAWDQDQATTITVKDLSIKWPPSGWKNCHQRTRFFRHSLPPCLFISRLPTLLTLIETFSWEYITF